MFIGVSAGEELVMSFFFFQAEDGIRDHCVTGVQTCALPIWPPPELSIAPFSPGTRHATSGSWSAPAGSPRRLSGPHPDAVRLSVTLGRGSRGMGSEASTPSHRQGHLLVCSGRTAPNKGDTRTEGSRP